MNIKEQSITVCLLLASLLLSSCGLSQSFGPTVTATSITTATLIPIPSTLTPNPTLASTNTPIPPTPTKAIYLPFPSEVDTSGKIDTSIGTIVVTKAEIVPKDISGNQPAAGPSVSIMVRQLHPII